MISVSEPRQLTSFITLPLLHCPVLALQVCRVVIWFVHLRICSRSSLHSNFLYHLIGELQVATLAETLSRVWLNIDWASIHCLTALHKRQTPAAVGGLKESNTTFPPKLTLFLLKKVAIVPGGVLNCKRIMQESRTLLYCLSGNRMPPPNLVTWSLEKGTNTTAATVAAKGRECRCRVRTRAKCTCWAPWQSL